MEYQWYIKCEKQITEKYIEQNLSSFFQSMLVEYNFHRKELCNLYNQMVWKMMHILSFFLESHKAYITGSEKFGHKTILFSPNCLLKLFWFFFFFSCIIPWNVSGLVLLFHFGKCCCACTEIKICQGRYQINNGHPREWEI